MITIQIDTREPNWLAISFPTDPVGNDLISQVPGRRFSRSRRCWQVPNTRDSVVKLGQLFGKAYCRFDEAVVRLYKPTPPPPPPRWTKPLIRHGLHSANGHPALIDCRFGLPGWPYPRPCTSMTGIRL